MKNLTPPHLLISESITDLSKRKFFLSSAACCLPLILPNSVLAKNNDFWDLPRSLWLYRPSTKEMVKEVYWYDGKLNEPGYRAICTLLRDVKAQKVVAMDLRLLDVLRGVQGWLEANGQEKPIITTSGYRSLATNQAIEGASKNSQHLAGKAWDGHIEGVSTDSLAKFGQYLSGGGVGFYQGRGFVHLDSGNIRTWRS